MRLLKKNPIPLSDITLGGICFFSLTKKLIS